MANEKELTRLYSRPARGVDIWHWQCVGADGVGTADALFGNTDGTHWIKAGHAIIGGRAAHKVAAALGL